MRLLRAAEVPFTGRDRIFRYSRTRALAWIAAAGCAAAALIWVGLEGHGFLPLWVAGVIGLGMLLMKRFLLARFRTSNWLVRVGDFSLFIQFRSYLNHHFSADEQTVLSLGFSEIRSARLVRQSRILPDLDVGSRRPGMVERRLCWIELEIEVDDTLRRALAAEAAHAAPRQRRVYGSTGIRYGHQPVVLDGPNALRIEWGVTPGPEGFLALLAPYVKVEPSLQETRDYKSLTGAGREEQERRLAELARGGRTLEAIALARAIHGHDLAQARDFVEAVRNGDAGPRGPRVA